MRYKRKALLAIGYSVVCYRLWGAALDLDPPPVIPPGLARGGDEGDMSTRTYLQNIRVSGCTRFRLHGRERVFTPYDGAEVDD